MAECRGDADRRPSERLLLLGCAAAYSVANIGGWIIPQVVSGAMERFHLSTAAAGIIPTSELILIAVGSSVLAARPPAISLRLIAITCGLLTLAANVLSPFAPSFPVLLGLRCLSGLLTGALMFSASAPVASIRSPDKGYAIINAASTAFGSVALLAIPSFLPRAHGLDYYAYGFLLLVPTFAFFVLVPSVCAGRPVASGGEDCGPAPRFRLSGAAVALFLGLMLASVHSFSVVTLSVRIGHQLGASEAFVSTALGMGSTVAIVATLLAGLVRETRRWPPVVCMLFLTFAANFVATHTAAMSLFRICLIANLASAYFLLPLYMGYAATLDPSGRVGGMTMGAFVAATAVAPALGGLVVDLVGLRGLGVAGLPLYAGAIILLTIVERAVRRSGSRARPSHVAGSPHLRVVPDARGLDRA